MRFSKESVKKSIEVRVKYIQEQFNFDPDNGSSQVNGKSTGHAIAYGQYDALCTLYQYLFNSTLR